MLTKNQILKTIKNNKSLFQTMGVDSIGLFGSYAFGKANKNSDVDILLDFEEGKETFDNLMLSCDLLEKIFANHKLDIVTKNGLSPYIGPHILKNVVYV